MKRIEISMLFYKSIARRMMPKLNWLIEDWPNCIILVRIVRYVLVLYSRVEYHCCGRHTQQGRLDWLTHSLTLLYYLYCISIDSNLNEDTTVQFQELNRAYEVLSDPSLKKMYDMFGGTYILHSYYINHKVRGVFIGILLLLRLCSDSFIPSFFYRVTLTSS